MLKQPVAGRVKTRLARDIGAVAATLAYRSMVNAMAARLGIDARWQTVLAVSPDSASASRMFPRVASRRTQGSGDLGHRLQRIFTSMPHGPVVVIGTDIPAITPDDIAAAFRALGSHDAVFGPSNDGGYWLVGLRRMPRVPSIFANVRWSSEYALVDTEANLASLRIARLKHHDDVDTAADLARLRGVVGRRVLPRLGRAD